MNDTFRRQIGGNRVPAFHVAAVVIALLVAVYIHLLYSRLRESKIAMERQRSSTASLTNHILAARRSIDRKIAGAAIVTRDLLSVAVEKSSVVPNIASGDKTASNTTSGARMKENSLYELVRRGELEEEIDFKYGALFSGLELDPQTALRLRAILVEKHLAIRDAFNSSTYRGKSLAQVWEDGLEAIGQPMELAINSLLGAERYAKYQNYQLTISPRNTVNLLRTALEDTDNALGAAQVELLVHNFSERLSPEQLNGQARFNLISTRGSFISNRDIVAAQTILSPAQVQAFVSIQLQTEREQQLIRMMRNAR